MKHNTATLSGLALDQAAHKALGPELTGTCPNYSGNWAVGGPLIEFSKISIIERGVEGWAGDCSGAFSTGPTPLIAALRALVASKFGDEVEL
ncbi:MAG: phage protein NinX family protein [Pseudomonadota bacterium]